jgi:hypothetical protein
MYDRYAVTELASSWFRGVTKSNQELPDYGVEKGRNEPGMKVTTLQNSLH